MGDRVRRSSTLLPVLFPIWVCPGSVIDLSQAEIDSWCVAHVDDGEPAPPNLRVPPPYTSHDMKNAFDTDFRNFLRNRVYATELNWSHDMNWRMTGPYVGVIGHGEFYGVHSTAVRIYYSPEVIGWLCSDRQGTIADGAMIIKEQHPINEALGISESAQAKMRTMPEDRHKGEEEEMVTLPIDEALAGSSRLIVCGSAGSGKTTLLKWVAVKSASRSFDGPLTRWNNTVPFFLRLRQFSDSGLPPPEVFPRF